ncbi:MAG: sterol desaturase family protein [Nitrospiraceae bacterium]
MTEYDLIAVSAFICVATVATTLELWFPTRTIPYRHVILGDLGALLLYVAFFQVAIRITDRIHMPNYVPIAIFDLRTPIKLVFFCIVEDFGLYWAHRFMHTKHVWRVHKWHHSARELYWLSAVRATIPHMIIFNLTYVAALPFLYNAPMWVFYAIMVEHMVRNAWMHMNVTWRSSWLEWIFVTPRYHRIHHSAVPDHYTANLGSLFTVWDRLFGTYVNPEDVKGELTFGTGEQDQPVRLILGV